MCSKCKEFDEQIARYRRMEVYITDELMLAGIRQLIGQASAERATLHLEVKK